MNDVSFEFLEVLPSREKNVVKVRGLIHSAPAILQISRADTLLLVARLLERLEEIETEPGSVAVEKSRNA